MDMPRSFINQNLFLIASEDVELYRVDSLTNDHDGFVSYVISYYRSRTRSETLITATSGAKSATFKSINFVFSSKIDKEKYLDKFLLLEAISITILSLKYSKNVSDYRELYTIFERLSLADRMKIFKMLWPDNFPKCYSNLLQLRNQLMHSYESEKLRYGKDTVWADGDFNKVLCKDFSNVIFYLLSILRDNDRVVSALQEELSEIN